MIVQELIEKIDGSCAIFIRKNGICEIYETEDVDFIDEDTLFSLVKDCDVCKNGEVLMMHIEL